MEEIEKQQYLELFLRVVGGAVEHILTEGVGKKMGFALLVFDLNKPGICNYISNAQRSDMITSLREAADRLEKGQDLPPAHATIQ